MLKVKDRYLFEDDKPFFYLGDTGWLMLEKLSWDEMVLYLKNRRSLGFNVIQVVLHYALPDKSGIENGMPVYDRDTQNEKYYETASRMISFAESLGLKIALLPTWGSFFTHKIMNENNVEAFAKKIVSSFSHHKNLIWVLGGDVRGSDAYEAFDKFGTVLKALDPEHLITFHPFGRTLSARWFNSCPWLDFNMFQSGHRRYDQKMLQKWDDETDIWYGEDNYRYVEENNSMSPVKPCLDAEPSYEGIIQGLHDPRQPYWEEKDVRRYAYWSVFAGACGFTYGHNAIIQFYDPDKGRGAYGVRESWVQALHAPAAGQLKTLKSLMESVDYTKGREHNDYLSSVQKERYHHVSIFAGENFLFAYTYTGEEFKLNLKHYKDKALTAYWLNPQSGVYSYMGVIKNEDEKAFCPVKRYEDSNDWVLILKY
ncbi:MAG: glycoside hydrolase family 140 protein [Sphaerochaetaceae bacterium]|nr:glycoside hydrolase family 140 protein [Sphaerochaetaceae bacterium]